MKRILILVCGGFLLSGCEVKVDHKADVDWISEPGMEDMPFSAAVRVDNLLFLSGAIGYDAEAQALVEGGIQPETRKTLENIAATLEANGSSMDRVVKCTVFLADMSEWGAMNEVYVTFFPNKPARSALGANGLALNARTEIECIAVVD
ncbi:MAG: RidA family protein [Woeseiaceae bacterium]|nr:RidA family protein [Woeseiaceae bacterium]NIP21876.1 RidA family protein [Woeseiaceae bacterium]NIS90961.1 RidA family protein [Woeseiaceae bacterium]